jgi:hypothetical protein
MKRNGMPFPTGIPLSVMHRLDFSFVFSGPLPASINLFSSRGIFGRGRYQLGWTGIFSYT